MTAPIKILVVTKDEQHYKEIEVSLASLTLNTFYANDSHNAVQILKEQAVDVIISDTDIGDLDAWRLVRMVRANLFQCASDTAFILLADTHSEHIAQTAASAFAMNRVITKHELFQLPYYVEKFATSIDNIIEKPSILVIEDEPDISELCVRFLKNHYTIDTAFTGKTGLETYLAGKYDIVLLDVQLPEMTGGEVLKAIMKHDDSQNVVIMTAHGGTDVAKELMVAGAVDFIPKPFKGDQLRKVIGIAAQRENFLISNQQFEDKVLAIKSSEAQYKHLSEAHTRLLNHLSTVVMELDVGGHIVFVNKAWEELTGFSNEESEGRALDSFAYGDDGHAQQFVRYHLQSVLRGETHYKKIEFQLHTNKSESLWVEVQFNDLLRDGRISGVTVTLDNIDDRKKAELQLNHLASHDTLTDLYNRHHFDLELKRLSDTAVSLNYVHSLIYLDLDHFKVINDTQGHHQGDIILKEVAENIASFKRESDIFCRVGGDEFALLLPRTAKAEAFVIANDICDLLQNEHYRFDDRVFRISCSIGLTEINGSVESPETYLQQADIALFVAKKKGRNLAHLYQDEDRETEDFKASVQWVHVLQQAIINDQLTMHFQPVVCAHSRQVKYFEALVRLEIDGKLIMPGEFIPALERVEDINLLDHQVISKTISLISEHPVLNKVAINLSAQAFSDQRLLPLVQEKLNQYGVKPEQIIFEVTESASLSNLSATQDMINKLMELGCEFSIDDFGTGFSTFSYLKQLPANCVKIDGSFVKDMMTNPIDMALVKAICEVAKALDKTTVAEFVENEEIAIALHELGVDFLQGYHISRPCDIVKITQNYATIEAK